MNESQASGGKEPLLQVEHVSLKFGGLKALNEVTFSVSPGEVVSIIGPNGAGKTSMLNCVSGRYQPTSGNIVFKGKNLNDCSINDRAGMGLGRTFQNLALFGHMDVMDNIMVGRHHLMKKGFLSGSLYWLAGARKEEMLHRQEVDSIIEFLEIKDVRDRPAGLLSYGLQKRVELARAVALKPDLILLDEPMAGMNQEEKADMARFITSLNREWGMTVIMIEHDMGIVMDISDRVVVLDFGRKIAEGLPSDIMDNEHVRRAYLGEDDPYLDDLEDTA